MPERRMPWYARLLEWWINKIAPYVDGWKAYPPEWKDNGDDQVGKKRK